MYAETYTLDIMWLTIVLSGLMGLSSLVLYLIFRAIEPKHSPRGGEAVEPYIGGEHPSILSKPIVPEPNLYWAFISRNLRGLYIFLKKEMHTGRLSDWIKYMSSWFGLLLLLSLATIIYMLVSLWGG